MKTNTTLDTRAMQVSGRNLGVMALAFTGCAIAATAYLMRRKAVSQEVQAIQEESALSTWEGEGGNTSPASTSEFPAA
mgnify:CR=1 FL=1